MAGDARDVELIGKRIRAVAITAILFCVLAIENEPSVACMIEARIIPTHRVVAIATFIAAAAIMCVVFGVAAKAGCRRILECVVCMTIRACRLPMFSNQGIVGCVVIEFDIQPVDNRVAVATLCAQRPAMGVVIFVTGETVRRSIPVFLVADMTIAAGAIRVLSKQREIGKIMIECALDQADDIRSTALMLGVAIGAISAVCLLVLTVKSVRAVDVRSHVFMTIQAQSTLPASLESLMTSGAFLLIVGMGFGYCAGHDQCFNLSACGYGNDERRGHQYSN